MGISPAKLSTRSLRRLTWGADICQLLASTLNSADAGELIRKHLHLEGKNLVLDGLSYNLQAFRRIVVLGAGKAVAPMAEAVNRILGHRITAGLCITKDSYLPRALKQHSGKLAFIEAGHPIPDQRNLEASVRISALVGNLQKEDLVICLLSGGGSSLLTKPAPGVNLAALQDLTSMLLSCGATITEINTIRKHLDEFKGGGLAKHLAPATVITLILSDVIGDPIDMIASGPTAADPTSFRDAWRTLEKYRLGDRIPGAIRSYLESGMAGKQPETLKPGDPALNNVNNVIIGNNSQTLQAAIHGAEIAGFSSLLLSSTLEGEASQAGKTLAAMAKNLQKSRPPSSPCACLLAGGETTVTIRGNGLGGRNQEFALGAAEELAGEDPLVLISLATDGGDGPTDAAGAVVTNETYALGKQIGLDPADYLSRNDSYHYFEALGDLVRTGPTFTNVNDLVFIFAF